MYQSTFGINQLTVVFYYAHGAVRAVQSAGDCTVDLWVPSSFSSPFLRSAVCGLRSAACGLLLAFHMPARPVLFLFLVGSFSAEGREGAL